MRFRGTVVDKWFFTGLCCVVPLLFTGYLFDPGRGGVALRISVAVWICGSMWLAWRSTRMGQVIADENGVRAYGMVRRWSWAWSELDHFGTSFPSSVFASGHEALVAYTRDGRTVPPPSINASSRSRSAQPWVWEAAATLNRCISSGR